jgi:hypothetical protein
MEVRMPSYIKNDAGDFPLLDLSYDDIEQLIIRAYVKLIFATKDTAGSRTTTIARFCSLEVRLTEFPDAYISKDMPPFWIEIYSHATRSTVDSCGCFEFNEAELATAAGLIQQAKQRREIYH